MKDNVKRAYTLRSLKDSDLFPLLKIMRKIGIKDLEQVFTVDRTDTTDEDEAKLVVLGIADIVIGNLDRAETEIYEFWSNLSGMTVDELKDSEFGTLPLMIFDTFSGVKNTDFFKVLSKLLYLVFLSSWMCCTVVTAIQWNLCRCTLMMDGLESLL